MALREDHKPLAADDPGRIDPLAPVLKILEASTNSPVPPGVGEIARGIYTLNRSRVRTTAHDWPESLPARAQPETIAVERKRSPGFVSRYKETVRGGCCFGAPLRTNGDVLAAIGISLRANRLTSNLEKRIPAPFCSAAVSISRQISARNGRTA